MGLTEVLALLGLALPMAGYWLTRPRLRVRIRDDGMFGEQTDLVFEATNHGDRVTSLSPVVSMRGIVPRLRRQFWAPFGIRRLAVPIECPGDEPVEMVYQLRETNTRLEPHETRIFRGQPGTRRPDGPVYFRTYSFRLAGGWRRPLRVRTLFTNRKQGISRWSFAWAKLRWFCGRPPSSRGGSVTEDDWDAQRGVRDVASFFPENLARTVAILVTLALLLGVLATVCS